MGCRKEDCGDWGIDAGKVWGDARDGMESCELSGLSLSDNLFV
jgi:hypothetical protein